MDVISHFGISFLNFSDTYGRLSHNDCRHGRCRLSKDPILSKKTISVSVIFSLIVGMIAAFGVVTPAYASVAPTPTELNNVRTQILNATNVARAQAGLPPLVANAALNNVAQNCSLSQANNNTMAHCPNYYDNYPGGWTSAGENVASGYTSVQSLMTGWLNSPGHRANILTGSFTDLGVGYYFSDSGIPYYTQNFGAYSSTQTVPSAVRNVDAVAQTDGSVNVLFSEPTYNGNTQITSYTITATAPGQTTVTTNVPTTGTHNVTGLTPGVEWTFAVVANNAVGSSVPAPTDTAIPVGPPSVSIPSIEVTSNTAQVFFDITNNGADITNITLTPEGETPVNLPLDSQWYTYYDLTPGSNHNGTLSVTNSNGTTTVPFAFETLAVAPDAPAVNTVVENKTSLRATWTAPEFDGGADVTGYTVALYDTSGFIINEVSVNADDRTYTFENLTRGLEYSVGVTATNSAGTSTSNPQTITVPYTDPSAPQNVQGTLTDEGQVTLNWQAPTDTGGIEISKYTIQVYAGSTLERTLNVNATVQTDYSYVVSNLNPGTVYTFRVIAQNYASLSSVAGVSNAISIPAVVVPPAAVENIRSTSATTNSVTVVWDAPLNNGGSAIESYKWSISNENDGVVASGTTTDTFVTVEDLNLFTGYTIKVEAVNSKGTGASASANVSTLADKPSIPTITGVTPLSPTSTEITVRSFNDGGDSNITYTVSIFVNGEQAGSETSTNGKVVFNNLTLSTDYTVEILATNSGGTSEPGASSFSTPYTSGPVTFNTTETERYTATVSWNAPENPGSYAVEGYYVSFLNSQNQAVQETRVDADVKSITVETTENGVFRDGQTYTVKVTPLTYDTDLAGQAAETTFTFLAVAPYASPSVTATIQGRSVVANWETPTNDGGSPVTNYIVNLYEGDTSVYFTTVTGNTVTIPVTKANTDYRVTVLPANAVGTNINSVTSSNIVNSGAFPPATPDVVADVDEETLEVTATFSVTDDGGSPVTNWEYRYFEQNSTPGVWVSTVADTINFTGENGKTYILEVRAYNTAGVSSVSTTEVEVPVGDPAPVTGLSTYAEGTTIFANWTVPTETGGAPLQSVNVVVVNSEDQAVFYEELDPSATSIEMLDFDPYTFYTVEVTVANTEGFYSPVVSELVRTEPGQAPQPTDVSISIYSKSLLIQWVNGTVEDETLQQLLTTKVEIFNAETGEEVYNTQAEDYVFFSAEYGASYYAVVTSYFYSWANTFSEPVTTETVTVAPVTPEEVTNLNVTFDRLDATVSWTPGFDGGAAQEFTVTLTNDVDIQEIVTAGNSVTFEDLTPNVEYAVSVTPTNSVGQGPSNGTVFQTATVAPSSARNLTGEANGTTVSYVWDAPTDNGGGTVAYDYSLRNSNNVEVASGSTNTTSFSTDANIVRGETYKLTVIAKNSAGSAPSVTSDGVFVTPVAPNPVTGLTGTANATNDVTLTWSAPAYDGGSPVTGYVVTTPEGVVNTAGTSIVLDQDVYNFAPNTNYEFTVAAVTAYGTATAIPVEVTTNVVAPGAPEVALDYNNNAGSLTISYVPGSTGGEANTFSVNVTRNGEDYYTAAVTGPVTIQVTRGAEYVVVVTATNSAGSTDSTPAKVVVDAVTPDAPTNVSGVLSADNEFVAAWDAPAYDGGSPVTGYVWTVTNTDGDVVETGSTVDTTVAVTLPANTELTFTVVAVNAVGESVASVPYFFTTNVVSPSGLEIEVDVTATTATFTGTVGDNGGSPVTAQDWVVRDSAGEIVASGSGETFTAENLIHATSYTVEYVVSNGASTAASVTVEFVTAPVVASAPENVKATVASATSVKVEWDAPTDNGGAVVTGYIVTFVDQANTHTGTVEATGTSVTVEELNLGSTYTFTVVAVNEAGESDASVASNAVKTAPATQPTPLSEEMLLDNWDSFPPVTVTFADGIVTVTGLDESLLNSWLGGFVYSDPTWVGWAYNAEGTVQYDVSALPAGKHSLAVYNEAGNVVGVASFVIPADSTDNGGTTGNGASNNNGTTTTAVEKTGQDTTGWLYLGGGFLLLGLAVMVIRRRNNVETVKVKK